MSVCIAWDQFMDNYAEGQPHWRVTLNNGEQIFQDDHRPGECPTSAWLRLHEYCKQNNLHIVDMSIRFRDNVHALPSNADGYYFSLGVRAGLSCPVSMPLFFVGTLQNGVLMVQCWKVPEMLYEWTEERDPEGTPECLIRKR
jgi:hypothetical protein